MVGSLKGPVSYEQFKHEVRKYRRTDLLIECAKMAAVLEQGEMGLRRVPRQITERVTGFLLAGVARTAFASGTEFRSKVPTVNDLIRLCWFCINVDDPNRGVDIGRSHMRQLMARYAYQQFASQLSEMENIGRSLVLFEDLATPGSGMPSQDDWRDKHGASISDLAQVGMTVHHAAVQYEGRLPMHLLGAPETAGRYGTLTPAEALDVIERFYTTDLETAVELARALERPRYETWSPNPLQGSPILRLPKGTHIVVWPRAVIDRFSPSGLFYAGLEAFGDTFSDPLGDVFQTYVGNLLELIRHAEVHPEVLYVERKQEKRTCDWALVTKECVVLIEVKATRPVIAARVGDADGYDDLKSKIGKAAEQLDTTAKMIRDRHEAVEHIPADRPIVGLVMTLEPFFLVDSFLYEDLLAGKSIPISVSHSHIVETITATLADHTDIGDRLLTALTDKPDPDPFLTVAARLDRALEGLDTTKDNPILAAAWERIFPTTPQADPGSSEPA